MNLFQVIRRYLVLTLLAVFIIGCLSIYFIFKIFIHQSADQILYEYKDRIENYIALNDTLILFKSSLQIPQRIESYVITNPQDYREGIKDTLMYNEGTGYFQAYRQLSFVAGYRGKSHLVIINQPSIEMDDLLYIILGSLFSIFILFLMFTYLIDFYLKKKAWAPFYKTLSTLNNYDIEKELGKEIKLDNSNIKEFDMLNHALRRMVSKINYDYENMKMFSEDISHEMQTPLAIIKSKIEILRQERLGEKEYLESLMVISRSTTRLSKLNSSLLLLTKITNDQFRTTQSIDLSKTLDQQLLALEELIDIKRIKLETNISKSIQPINDILLDILISNLLNNAIRHNVENGFLKITLDQEKLEIENSCDEVEIDQIPNLFDRLVSLKKVDSTGLGLSIVKSICEKSNITISYKYMDVNVFRILLNFNSKKHL